MSNQYSKDAHSFVVCSLVAYLEVLCKLPVVRLSVQGLGLLAAVAALDAAVDDHDGRPKARLEPVLHVALVGLPRPVNHVQHAWLGRLRVGVEPGG